MRRLVWGLLGLAACSGDGAIIEIPMDFPDGFTTAVVATLRPSAVDVALIDLENRQGALPLGKLSNYQGDGLLVTQVLFPEDGIGLGIRRGPEDFGVVEPGEGGAPLSLLLDRGSPTVRRYGLDLEVPSQWTEIEPGAVARDILDTLVPIDSCEFRLKAEAITLSRPLPVRPLQALSLSDGSALVVTGALPPSSDLIAPALEAPRIYRARLSETGRPELTPIQDAIPNFDTTLGAEPVHALYEADDGKLWGASCDPQGATTTIWCGSLEDGFQKVTEQDVGRCTFRLVVPPGASGCQGDVYTLSYHGDLDLYSGGQWTRLADGQPERRRYEYDDPICNCGPRGALDSVACMQSREVLEADPDNQVANRTWIRDALPLGNAFWWDGAVWAQDPVFQHRVIRAQGRTVTEIDLSTVTVVGGTRRLVLSMAKTELGPVVVSTGNTEFDIVQFDGTVPFVDAERGFGPIQSQEAYAVGGFRRGVAVAGKFGYVKRHVGFLDHPCEESQGGVVPPFIDTSFGGDEPDMVWYAALGEAGFIIASANWEAAPDNESCRPIASTVSFVQPEDE